MCGLCLPHCPTFVLHETEAESPRGRIALIQGMASGALEADSALLEHLDNCLGCRACEAMCPSHVRYGKIRDNAIRLLAEKKAVPPPPASTRLSHYLLERSGYLAPAVYKLLQLYRQSRLRRFIKPAGNSTLGKFDALLPNEKNAPAPPAFSPAIGQKRGSVALFHGCSAELLEPATAWSAIRLLNLLGYDVHSPQRQVCCGALAVQRGDAKTAHQLQRQNFEAFAHLDIEAIISFNSGCGARLQEYESPLHARDKVVDICDFLRHCEWPAPLPWKPLQQRIALHTPCTLRNVLKAADAPAELLRKIPEIDLIELDAGGQCCGAAGDYMLNHPETAAQLRTPKLDALEKSGARVLLSSNAGCARHLAAGAAEKGIEIAVMHPVVLLEKQIQVTN